MENDSLFLFLLCVLLPSAAADDPCNFFMSINITGGYVVKSGQNAGAIMHEGITYAKNQHYVHEDEDGTNHTRGCICSIKPCMRKCCPIGQVKVNRDCADSQDPELKPFRPPIYSLDKNLPVLKADHILGLVFGNPCAEGRGSFALNPYSPPFSSEDRFYLQPNGQLYIPNLYSEPKYLSQMSYCMDAFTKAPLGYSNAGWTTQYLPLICAEDDAEDDPEVETSDGNEIVFIAFFIGFVISISFLMATFFVYAIIPELRNLNGKALMSYIAGLILSYVLLAVDQTITRQATIDSIPIDGCLFMAFSLYFFFLVSFFWVNVMCFDIWRTFRSSICIHRHGRLAAEKRRFIFYCLYAWGTPLVLTGVSAFMQFYANLPDSFVRPNFGEIRCWFSDWKAQLLYFSIPVIVLVVCNLTLFANTSYNILKINRETAMLKTGDNARNDQLNNEKQRFHVYVKLFLVMGVNWVVEMLSFVLGGSNYIWIVTDLCNTMLGVFIFIIFVWKKNVKILLMKRLHLLRTKNTRELTTSQSYLSRTTSGNSSHTCLSRTKSEKPLLDESTV